MLVILGLSQFKPGKSITLAGKNKWQNNNSWELIFTQNIS